MDERNRTPGGVAPQGQPTTPQGQQTPYRGQPVYSQGQQAPYQGQPAYPQGQQVPYQGQPAYPQGQQVPYQGRPAYPQGQQVPYQGQPAYPQGQQVPYQGQPAYPQGQQVPYQGQPAYPQGQQVPYQGRPAYPQGQQVPYQGQPAYPQGQQVPYQGRPAYPQGQQVPYQGQPVYPQGQTPYPGGPGYPQPPAPQKPRKKRLWLIPVIIAVILALAAGGAALYLNQPQVKVAMAARNSMKALAKGSVMTLADSAGKAVKTKPISLTLELDGTQALRESAGGYMGAMPIQIAGTAGIYLDAASSTAALQLDAGLMGSQVDLLAYAGKKDLVFSSRFLLEEGAYGVDLSTAKKRLESSEFGPKGAYYPGQESYDALVELLDALSGDRDLKSASPEEFQALAPYFVKYGKEVYAAAFRHGELSREKETVRLEDLSFDAARICLDMDSEALANYLLDMAGKVNEDKELKKALYAAAEKLDEERESNPSLQMFYRQQFGGRSLEDSLDELYKELQKLLERPETLKKRLEGKALRITFTINAKNQLVGLAVRTDTASGEDTYTTEAGLLLGPEVGKLQAARAYATSVYGNREDTSEFKLRVTQDDHKGTAFRLVSLSGDKERFRLEWENDKVGNTWTGEFKQYSYWDDSVWECWRLNWDRGRGDYTLGYWSYSYWTVLRGQLKEKNDAWTLNCSSVAQGRGEVNRIPTDLEEQTDVGSALLKSATLTLDTDAKMPTKPAYQDVLDLSKEEIDKLVEKAQYNIYPLYYAFMMLGA